MQAEVRTPDDRRVDARLASKRVVEHDDEPDCEADCGHVNQVDLQAEALRCFPAAQERRRGDEEQQDDPEDLRDADRRRCQAGRPQGFDQPQVRSKVAPGRV